MATVFSRRADFTGTSVGARFVDGVAEDVTDRAALAYFERAGYRVEHAAPAPERPGDKASKAEWVAYVVALGLLDEEAADKLTRDQLAEQHG